MVRQTEGKSIVPSSVNTGRGLIRKITKKLLTTEFVIGAFTLILLHRFKCMRLQTSFKHGIKHYEADQKASTEQFNLGPYCLQCRLPKNISRQEESAT